MTVCPLRMGSFWVRTWVCFSSVSKISYNFIKKCLFFHSDPGSRFSPSQGYPHSGNDLNDDVYNTLGAAYYSPHPIISFSSGGRHCCSPWKRRQAFPSIIACVCVCTRWECGSWPVSHFRVLVWSCDSQGALILAPFPQGTFGNVRRHFWIVITGVGRSGDLLLASGG